MSRFSVVLLLALPAVAQDFDDLLAKWGRGTRPGIAMAIIQRGKTTYTRTLGYADLPAKTAVGRNTRFLAGSISKQFTAAAILLLAAEGKLRLDDAAARFVPEMPEYGRSITIRQLLHHIGGLPEHEDLLAGKVEASYFSASDGARPAPFTTKDAFAALRGAGLLFQPGAKWEYSNTGYMVLGQVIERVCRCTYSDFLTRRIFGPLGMKDSMVIPAPPARISRLALAYTGQEGGGWRDISYSRLNFMVGHDGVVSTIDDMARWAAGTLFPAGAFQSGLLNDGKLANYGFGWRLSELDGKHVGQHEGCWAGYRNAIVHVPEAKLSVVVLTNAADGKEFWNCEENVILGREIARRSLAH
jgi:CubicO group peptidase (beta-lactamase class C family)